MFRIVCMVEDGKLPKVLHGLAGLVHSMEPPQPVAGGPGTPSKVEGGNLSERVYSFLVKAKVSTMTLGVVREAAKKCGGMESSAQHVVKVLKKAGLLKQVGKGVFQLKPSKGVK